ncbi:allantoin permease [Chania multitudinisentens RB-25]|uniref:Allantoin permease n=1 Tax=Chania multitudinisentens RB-25 TaxID=1441930 RepID=W0LE83_9GAMM|nr:cytosine permease [Chania multitudinisentens]AHG20582.1 allantoin permease [Chania multitudinisentens RB-25]
MSEGNQRDEYALKRVPLNKRLPFWGVALVHAGMLTALDQFMLGAALGHGMSVLDAYIAIGIASIICGVITYGMGLAGMQEGMSCSLLSRWCGFGRIGSAFIGIMIAISLMGWFGVQTAIFGKSLDFALDHRLGFNASVAIVGIGLTILVAIGFKALRFIARIGVPVFIIGICYVSWLALSNQDISVLLQSKPNGEVISISGAITIIIGAYILAALQTPDIARYVSNRKQVLGMTVLTIVAGEFVLNGLAIALARALNVSDVVSIMSMAAGGVGLTIAIFSTLRINDLNLYCSSLGLANAIESIFGIKINYIFTTLAIGTVGTTLSILGILDRFIGFLELMGIVFPPIVGIMLVEYFIIRTYRKVLDESRASGQLPGSGNTPSIGWTAIAACAMGAAVGFLVEAGIPALNSLVVASVFYWAATVIVRKKRPLVCQPETY